MLESRSSQPACWRIRKAGSPKANNGVSSWARIDGRPPQDARPLRVTTRRLTCFQRTFSGFPWRCNLRHCSA
jgi:hypothetical protein